ncbi:hypothetical protein [Nocardioides sp. WS12]|uniref:hypothetical protein n=1 Tax=Nocardioides sp. WS12 TaxID=2486272 RepID=UPI0015FA55E6|nr:hypothetical protein [Nocardioides sp. WS12]
MNCLHCGTTTSNGLALCELSQMKAAGCLEYLPVYFRNLARWRPGRAGSRPVPGSRVLYDGETRKTDRVSAALDEIGAKIVGWAMALADDRGIELPDMDGEADQTAALCRILAEHLTSIATLEWAGTFVAELSEHEDALRALTEDVAPGWYAGGCGQCNSGTYVIPGLTWVKCNACGVVTYARDHLDTILDEARDWVARPKALAEAVVAMVDTEQSVIRLHKRISKWGEREQISVFRRADGDGDEIGPKRFLLGDVMDMLRAEGQTRTNDDATDTAVAS